MDFGEDGTRSKLRPREFELPVREWNGLSVKMILQQNSKDESNRNVCADVSLLWKVPLNQREIYL